MKNNNLPNFVFYCMATLRSILSEMASDVRSFTVDDRISFRYLHTKFNGKIQYFLRQDARSRDILRDKSLWKTINCVQLEDTDAGACGFIDRCHTLKKSAQQLPDAFNTNYGLLVKVFGVGINGKEYKLINSYDYASYTNREYGASLCCWIENDYLYIPNTEVECVKVVIFPKDQHKVDVMNGTVSDCASVLDSTVDYPDYLIALAKQEVLKEVSGIYKRTVQDERGDDNTNNK